MVVPKDPVVICPLLPLCRKMGLQIRVIQDAMKADQILCEPSSDCGTSETQTAELEDLSLGYILNPIGTNYCLTLW